MGRILYGMLGLGLGAALVVGNAAASPSFAAYNVLLLGVYILAAKKLFRLLHYEREYQTYMRFQLLIGFLPLVSVMLFALFHVSFRIFMSEEVEDIEDIATTFDTLLGHKTRSSKEIRPELKDTAPVYIQTLAVTAFSISAMLPVQELNKLGLGNRFRFDALSISRPALPFTIASFVTPVFAFQIGEVLMEPLSNLLIRSVMFLANPKATIMSKTKIPGVEPRKKVLSRVPVEISWRAVGLSTAMLMGVAASKRHKCGCYSALAFFASSLIVVVSNLIFFLPLIEGPEYDWVWMATLRKPALQVTIHSFLLLFVLFLAQLIHNEVKSFYWSKYRKIVSCMQYRKVNTRDSQ